jgi:hypothetical protein
MGTRGYLSGLKRMERQAAHSSPSSAEDKNGGASFPIPRPSFKEFRSFN